MVNSTTNTNGDNSSLQITTVPSDNDRQAIQIVRKLEANLEALGFDVSLDMRSTTEFQRTVLVEQDFDMYVGTYPTGPDPDFLYEMLHSSFATEEGWQNPFGLTDFDIDPLLTNQRRVTSSEREAEVKKLLVEIAKKMPFVPICAPNGSRAVGEEMRDIWSQYHPHSRLAYFGNEETPETLTSIIMSSQPTRNLNPFSTEHRKHGTYIDLLYDSLATDGALVDDDTELEQLGNDLENDLIPWLATSVDAGDSELTVSLRDDVQFHDGTDLTAEDVQFTYEFIADTSMGRSGSGGENAALPATNYRRHASTVESVRVNTDYEVTIEFETNQVVAERALLVPILPKHIWGLSEENTDQQGALEELDESDIPSQQGRWSLLGADDEDLIVGSGPYQYANSTERDSFTLERFDDHFTYENDDIDVPEVVPETLEFLNDTSSASAVQQVEGGVVDVTTSRIEPHVIEDLTADDSDDILTDHQPWSFYHIGFNDGVYPCSEPAFRHAVARVLDREWVVDTIFSGHADPIWTPVTDHPLSDEELEQEATDWMAQRGIELGGNGPDENQPFAPFCELDPTQPGRVDFEEARRVFESAGFQYDEEGNLIEY